jgi:hypothetical protein
MGNRPLNLAKVPFPLKIDPSLGTDGTRLVVVTIYFAQPKGRLQEGSRPAPPTVRRNRGKWEGWSDCAGPKTTDVDEPEA